MFAFMLSVLVIEAFVGVESIIKIVFKWRFIIVCNGCRRLWHSIIEFGISECNGQDQLALALPFQSRFLKRHMSDTCRIIASNTSTAKPELQLDFLKCWILTFQRGSNNLVDNAYLFMLKLIFLCLIWLQPND